MSNYRKELKYFITFNDFNIINNNLNSLLKKDKYCNDDYYQISSIYFDNYNMTSYNQVLNGISERWKYRIRFYNYDKNYIKLEKKYKVNGLTLKESTVITYDTLNNILKRRVRIDSNNSPLLNELILKIKTEYLRPVILIEYDRIPYIYKAGNVRITLDYNIRYTNIYSDIFNKEKKIHYLNERILEVKYLSLIHI